MYPFVCHCLSLSSTEVTAFKAVCYDSVKLSNVKKNGIFKSSLSGNTNGYKLSITSSICGGVFVVYAANCVGSSFYSKIWQREII